MLVKQRAVAVFQQNQKECFRDPLKSSHTSIVKSPQKAFSMAWEKMEGDWRNFLSHSSRTVKFVTASFARTLNLEVSEVQWEPASLSVGK